MAKKGKSAAARLPARREWLDSVRRREIAGSALVVVAVVTLVSFAADGGWLTDAWLGLLRAAFGWGAVLFPFLVGGLGAWLVIDAADGIADVPRERIGAAVVLYVELLAVAHLIVAARPDAPSPTDLARLGAGGGYVGLGVAGAVAVVLGPWPALVAISLLAVVTLALAAGLTLTEMGAHARRIAGDLILGARDLASRVDMPGEIEFDEGFEEWTPEPAVAEAVEPPFEVTPPAMASEPEAVQAPQEEEAVAESRNGKARWTIPPMDEVLDPSPEVIRGPDDAEAKGRLIEDTFAEFGVPVAVVEINRGPTITQFGVEPGYVTRAGRRSRIKVSKIVNLQNDLALALAASPIRIQAPVPGRPYVGIEVPNVDAAVVTLRGVIETEAFRKVAAKGGIPIALGRDTSGNPVAADLASMPHLLIAGATGAGKSVALNGIVSTMLVTHSPDTLRLLLVDPKRVEMAPFRGLPHLAAPVVVDVERVVGILQWAVREMDRRYRLFAEHGARNLQAFNQKAARIGEETLPYLVLVVDELADLMMLAPEEVERLITRLAQLARATGIHLIIATQRPSVDVVTGLIKANFPSRIAFAVASGTDSRVILDTAGAEKLLGRGDMLYVSSDSSKLRRLQGCYVSDSEIERIVNYWRRAAPEEQPATADASRLGIPDPLIEADQWDEMMSPDEEDERDPLWHDAIELLKEHRSVSTSFLQRKLRIGYSRAARIVDLMEEAGIVGPAQGSQPRDVLVGFDDDGNMVREEDLHVEAQTSSQLAEEDEAAPA